MSLNDDQTSSKGSSSDLFTLSREVIAFLGTFATSLVNLIFSVWLSLNKSTYGLLFILLGPAFIIIVIPSLFGLLAVSNHYRKQGRAVYLWYIVHLANIVSLLASLYIVSIWGYVIITAP